MALIDAKFQSWAVVKDQLRTILQATDPQDTCVTIPYGLQLLHSLHHPHVVRCLSFYHSTTGDIYVTHIDTGACNEIYVWTISSLDEHVVKCIKFPIKAAISRLIFIPHHRVFVGFCSDMTLRTFSDLIHQCAELTQVTCLSTVLCMAYNECNDELITGGHGCLQTWKMTHIELRDPPTPGRPIECQITSDDWVRDLQIDKKHRQLVVLCDQGVCIIDYQTNKQVFFIRNWHETALTSCVFYRRLEYFITAAMDGSIKVWNAVVYSQVHEFIGHYDCVTGLVMHPTDPLLISSSKDGTIRVWRLDTFELTQRLDVGEKILGMRLAGLGQLYYYTLHDVKVYTFNQFHHMFTPVQSCIHKLARVKTSSAPTRILCAAEDGGVRLISAISGTILTIIYPMATYQVLTDIVYDPEHGTIYTVMATGDILVFNSTTNPCTADQLWVPGLADECVLCLTLIKLDRALGKLESPGGQSLIFAGLNSGQIILLEAQQHYMKTPVQAHIGQVTALEHSYGRLDGHCNTECIGGADRLLSIGSDKIVRVWAIELNGPKNLQIKLSCRKAITCSLCPTHISMLGNSLCMVLPNNVIHVYELLEDVKASVTDEEGTGGMSKMLGLATLHTHIKEHNHTKTVTALCNCPSLGLFATTSNDGSIKIWDLANTLVREVCFDSSLRSVCFANDRGDLLVGFQNHVSYVSITAYLPLSYMEKLVDGADYEDEAIEEPVRFNPDLRLWFSISDLPTFPTDAVLRRHMQQSMDHLQKHRLSLAPPGDRGDSEAVSRTLDSSRLSIGQDTSSPVPSLEDISRQSRAKTRVRFSSLRPGMDEPPQQLSQEGDAAPQQAEADSDARMDSPHAADVLPAELTPEDEGGEEESKMEAELEELTEEEEEEYNPWPIAPDGYIPNSVIRGIMGYRHKLEPIPESPWKLQPVPSAYEVAQAPQESDSYDRHEPFVWAPSSSEEEEELDYLSYESLKDDPSKSKLFEELGMANMSALERRKTLEILHTSGMELPGNVSIPQLVRSIKGKGGKRRRKSKGINAAETLLVRQKLKASELSMMEDESEDEEEEEIAVDGVPDLLRTIAANSWFPKGVTLRVEPVVRTLLGLLDEVADLQYRPVCEAMVQIFKQLGIPDFLMETVIEVYRAQLTSSRAIVRANAVKTLTSFGLDRRDVILCLLPILADDASDVRDATVEAVETLAGIHDRSGLMDYLEKIGFFKPYQGQQKEVIQDLARRYTPDPTHRPTLHPSRIQLLSRRRKTQDDDERPPSPPIDGLPCVSPALNVHNWLSQYQLELGQCPSGTDIFPGEEIDWTLESGRGKKNLLPPTGLRQLPGMRRTSVKDTPVKRLGPLTRAPPPHQEQARLEVVDEGRAAADFGQEMNGGTFDRSQVATKRRHTLHVQILEDHDKSVGSEKVQMEKQMQSRLRYHRDRYEQLKRHQGRPQQRDLVPSKAGLYSYYNWRTQMEAESEESELYETETSEWSEAALVRARAVIQAFADMPSQLRKPALDFPSESGVGGSSLFGSSAPRVDRQREGAGQQAEGSSGFFTETDLLGQQSSAERPRSKLTVENLQKHDAMSGKAKMLVDKGPISTGTVISHQTQKDWREFFSLPSIQRRKLTRQDAVSCHNAPAVDTQSIKCISSRVRVASSQGERGQRLLEKITVDRRRTQKGGAGPREVYCTPVPEKLTVNTKIRPTGVSHYGKINMSWTTAGPVIEGVSGKGHDKVISMTTAPPRQSGAHRKQWLQQQMLYPSLYNLRIWDEDRKRLATLAQAKQRTPPLPSVTAPPKFSPASHLVYRWTSPEPVIFSKELQRKKKRASFVRSCVESRIASAKKDKCDENGKSSMSQTTHIYLPYLPFRAPEMPVAPQNSTVIHHQATTRLPKIHAASDDDGPAATKGIEDIPESMEELNYRNPITIPLQ